MIERVVDGPKRSPKRWPWATVILAVLLIVAGIGSWVIDRSATSGKGVGPLAASHPFRYNVHGQAGRPYIWATVYLRNPTSERLTIDAVNPNPSTGLRVDKLRLGNPHGWQAVGGFYGPWPPVHMRRRDLLDVHGLVLRPHQNTRLFAELVAPKAGHYSIGGKVQVRYHVGGTSFLKVFHNHADALSVKA